MCKYGFLFFFGVFLVAQDLTPEEILTYVASHPKPESSIGIDNDWCWTLRMAYVPRRLGRSQE